MNGAAGWHEKTKRTGPVLKSFRYPGNNPALKSKTFL